MARTTARNIAEDLVLFILDQAGGQLRGATRLQKIAFLLVMEAGVKGIAFEPGKYGPYSRDIEDAVRRLSDEGLINTWEEPIEPILPSLMPAMPTQPIAHEATRVVYELTSAGKHEAKGAMHRVFDAIGFRPRSWLRAINIVGTWKDAPMIALLEYVYRKYQNYTVKSVIKDKIMRL